MQSSRRLEPKAGPNAELMWPTGKLVPDFKTVANFRRDLAAAIQAASRRFVWVSLRATDLPESSTGSLKFPTVFKGTIR
jgi:hypothetical protein